jgi:hypothetical protein
MANNPVLTLRESTVPEEIQGKRVFFSMSMTISGKPNVPRRTSGFLVNVAPHLKRHQFVLHWPSETLRKKCCTMKPVHITHLGTGLRVAGDDTVRGVLDEARHRLAELDDDRLDHRIFLHQNPEIAHKLVAVRERLMG